MPRKAAAAVASTKSTTRQAPSRTAAPVGFSNEDNDLEMDEIESDEDEGREGEDMLEMLAALKAVKKKQAKRANVRSAAFIKEKNKLYEAARADGNLIVKRGLRSLEETQAKVAELKAQEIPQEKYFKDILPFVTSSDESVQTLLALYPSLLEDLSPRRSEQIEGACNMLVSHPIEREKCLHTFLKRANVHLEQGREDVRIATDATALIRHYKALLLA